MGFSRVSNANAIKQRLFFARVILLLILGLMLVPLFLLASPKKSSEIPERREFPVNPEISPCTNFYDYACSKVKDSFQLREDRSRHIFAFSDSHERILEKKKSYLQGLVEKKDPKRSKRAKVLATIYRACMDKDAAVKEEKEIIKRGLRDMFNIAERKEFLGYLGRRIDEPEFSFIDFGTIPNLDNPDREDVYLRAGLKSLPERSYYENAELVAEFKKVIAMFFRTVQLDRPEERANWVFDFEKEFVQTYPLPAEWRDLYSKKTRITKNQLRKEFPSFEMKEFLKRVPSKARIRHMTPDNFTWLEKALKEKPLDVLKSVWLYRGLSSYMDDAYEDYYKAKFEFNRRFLGGPNERPERKERCTRLVMGSFEKEIDAELLPVVFPDFPEKRFRKLVERVRQSLISGIQGNTWLDPKTKRTAIRKMKSAELKVVKPRNYREWDFNPPGKYLEDRPYDNMKILSKALIEKAFRELKKNRDRSRWLMGPLTVNAYYNPPDNQFVLPIGILQYPFYDGSLTDEENLGAVGAVVGHELGHGIDDKGSRYDHKGRLRNWFTEKDMAEFKKRGSKLIAQFNEIGHNGQLTLGENIGDLVGLTFAYRTAFGPGEKGGEKKELPAEEQAALLDKKKRFFLQYARVWCDVTRPKYAERLLKVDPHSAPWARVNMQMKHQPAFQEAYACKKGDPMVLPDEERVRIW